MKAPTRDELAQLTYTIARRVARFLERQGLLACDIDDCMDAGGSATQGAVAENSSLAADAVDEDPLNQLLGHSITYRIAVGPQQGRKVFTLQTSPACDPADTFGDTPGNVAGFSLHAGVAAKAHERKKLERLCHYIARPAVSEKRLSLTSGGNVRYDVKGFTNVAGAGMRKNDELKTPYRDGTTQVIFEPLDFLARLVALVPKPRVNLTRADEEHPCSSPFGQPSVVQIHSR